MPVLNQKYSVLLLIAFCFFSSCANRSTVAEATETNNNLRTACLLSEIVYCKQPQDSIIKYLPDWRIIWSPLSVNGNYAFLAQKNNSMVLAIRGSLMEFSWDAFNNWIYQDLHITSQKKWIYTDSITGAYVSQGAYEGWENVVQLKDSASNKNLLQFLLDNINEETELLLTGHSLGGNLSTVVASWLHSSFKSSNKKIKDLNVISFAAPAAGNAEFAKDFDKKFPGSIRVENSNDMVPKFPVATSVESLGLLFQPSPSADSIGVSFRGISVNLRRVFGLTSLAIKGIQFANGFSVYTQTNGSGTQINMPLSGKNKEHSISNWFAEAGHQHSMEQYAAQLGVPVIK